jgi:competence protein ComEC
MPLRTPAGGPPECIKKSSAPKNAIYYNHHSDHDFVMNSRRFITTQPLVPVAALFAAGLGAGRAFDASVEATLVVIVTALTAWLLAYVYASRWSGIALAVAIIAAGAAVFQLDQKQVPNANIARLIATTQPRFITCRLTTITVPDTVGSLSDGPSVVQFVGQVDAVQTRSGWLPCSGRVIVRAPRGIHIQAAQHLQMEGLAARPAGPRNPGEFDNAAYLAASRIFVVLQVKSLGQIMPMGDGAETAVGLLQRFRLFMRQKLLQSIARDDPEAAHTMVALLLGHRDASISDIGRAFASSGAAHLLAISGFHIVLVAGVAWVVLRWLIPRPRQRAIGVALLVGLYILATPCGPPVLRAGLVMLMVLVASLMGRPPLTLNLLAAALLFVLLARPDDVVDAGLQLSFVVTAGLIVLAPRVHIAVLKKFLTRRAAIARAIGTPAAMFRFKLLRVCSEVALANAVGALLAMPLVAFHFHQVNPLSVVLGILILPLVLIGILLALAQLIAALASAATGWALAAVSVRWTVFMVWCMKHFAALPLAALPVRPPPWWMVLLLYAAVLLWLMRPVLKISKATALFCCCLAAPLLAGWYAWSMPRPALNLWQLSVSHGACIVGQTADGRTFLINAGAGSAQFTGRVLEPFLRIHGISKIDAAIFTSLDQTHAAAEILSIRRPAHVFGSRIDPGRFAFTDDLPKDLPLQLLAAGQKIVIGDRTAIDVLWPPDRLARDLPYAQKSMVLRITTGRLAVLVVGPGEDLALQAALNRQPPDDAVIVTGPGEPGAATIAALAKASPGLIVQDGPERDDEELLLPSAAGSAMDSSRGCVHVMIADRAVASFEQ